MDAATDTGSLEVNEQAATPASGLPNSERRSPIQIRLMAIAAAARFHGAELDRNDLRVADARPLARQR